MGKKVYAIKEGFDSKNNKKIENVIVNTWGECLSFVKGVKGAKYKSFEDINEAKKFLNDGEKLLRKEDNEYPMDCLHVYVDGSYNSATEEYSYGMVAMKNNVVLHIESGAGKNESASNIRQIAGELEGAVKGVQYALLNKEKRVVIFHDYVGICYHATGFWERREESSKSYYMKMNELMNSGVEVIFVKVDSHTGDLFNELVDEKCKEKLGIDSDKTVAKWLAKNTIQVLNEEVKSEIRKIAPNGEDNIIIVSNNDELSKTMKSQVEFESIEIDKTTNNTNNEEDIISDINSVISELTTEDKLRVLNYSKKLIKKMIKEKGL